MTKANMIEIIQNKEGRLWLEMAEYDSANAPITGSLSDQLRWETTDEGHLTALFAWNAVEELMEDLGIKINLNSPEHNLATELNNELFSRRQAARGVHYNERGEQIT